MTKKPAGEKKKMGQQIRMEQLYTDKWCETMESVLVDLAEVISSINEPRLMTKDDSLKIESLREQIHYLHCTLDHG